MSLVAQIAALEQLEFTAAGTKTLNLHRCSEADARALIRRGWTAANKTLGEDDYRYTLLEQRLRNGIAVAVFADGHLADAPALQAAA